MRRAFSGIFCAPLLALLAGTITASGATNCSTAHYIAGVQAAAAALHVPTPDVVAVRAQLEALQRDASPPTEALTPAIDDLSVSPPDVDSARSLLDAEAGALATPPGATCRVDPGPARAALHDVYASPVFAGLDSASQPSVLSRIASFLGNLIDGAARTLGTAGSIALLAVVVVAVLGYTAYRLRGQLGARRGRAAPEPAGDSDDPDTEWRAAGRAAEQGLFREAVRRAFRSALLAVALRGGVPVDPTWTTRELLRRVSGDADLLAALAPAASLFDVAWYSGRPVTREHWEQARQRCEAVRMLARKARPVAG